MRLVGVRSSRGRAVAGLVAVAALVLAGCRGTDVQATVHGDGTAEIAVEVFPSGATAERVDAASVRALGEAVFGDIGTVEVTRTDGSRRGYRMVAEVPDHRDLAPVLVEGVDVAGTTVRLFERFELVEEDTGWHLDAVLNPMPGWSGTAPAELEVAAMLDALVSDAESGVGHRGLKVSVALPGTVVSSNATSVNGGAGIWRAEDVRAPTHLRMRTESTDFPTAAQLVVGGGAAALLLGSGLVLWGAVWPEDTHRARRRRRRRLRFKGPAQPSGQWAPPTGAVVEHGEHGAVTVHQAPTPSSRMHPLPPLRATPTDAARGPAESGDHPS